MRSVRKATASKGRGGGLAARDGGLPAVAFTGAAASSLLLWAALAGNASSFILAAKAASSCQSDGAGCLLSNATRAAQQAADPASQSLARDLVEYARWRSARACAAAAAACASVHCYEAYLATAPASSPHRSEAETLRGRADQSCRVNANDVDGRYLARSRGGCGAKPDSVTVTISGAMIFWRHEFQGVAYDWKGTIDQSGHINASVGDSSLFAASGQYNRLDREMKMKYPQCESKISMSIISKLAN